jgi:hypothetical protein
MSLKTWTFMRVGAISLGTMLVVVAPLRAGDKTDVLYMKNGDRMTCEIQDLDAGALQVSLDYVKGNISVQWSEVQRLDSKRLFVVKLEDGSVYTGTLSVAEAPPGEATKLQISSGPGSFVLIDKGRIVQMGETSADIWHRFAVDISSGIIFSKGNSSTQYNFTSSVTYPRARWALNLDFNSALSSSSGVSASTRNQIDIGYYHLTPWNNYFYAGQAGVLQSTEQGIALQSSLGGGLGRYLKNSPRVSLAVLGGLAWQNTQYSPSETSQDPQDVLALLIGANLKVVTFSKTNLTVSARALPALSEPGRFFFATNATLYLKLISNLTLNFSFYGNWDTEPPVTYSGSDYGLSSGLGWSFGNKWTMQ